MPSFDRMTDAFLPMRSWFIDPWPRGPGCFAKTRFSRAVSRLRSISTAPCACIARTSRSATLATTITSFSSTQMMLLSVDAPSRMWPAAFSMCAVSSTTAGGLPGPAQMARLPLAIAAFTTAPPPVTTSSRISGCVITSCAVSIDGFARHVTTLGGPPAPVMARFSSATVSIEHRFASGCTQNTTLLPAASMPIALQMIVEVGLVDGVMAPITPKGAGSMSDRPWSPVTASGRRSSRPGVFSVTRRFLTILSS